MLQDVVVYVPPPLGVICGLGEGPLEARQSRFRVGNLAFIGLDLLRQLFFFFSAMATEDASPPLYLLLRSLFFPRGRRT